MKTKMKIGLLITALLCLSPLANDNNDNMAISFWEYDLKKVKTPVLYVCYDRKGDAQTELPKELAIIAMCSKIDD